MGYCRKSVDKWHQIRVLLKNPRKLRDQMVALPLSAENMIEAEQAKWDNLMMATKKLDFAEIEKHGSAPTKMLLRWVREAAFERAPETAACEPAVAVVVDTGPTGRPALERVAGECC